MNSSDKTLVVIQLTGGNDFMNTIVPYTNEHYFDARKKIVMDPTLMYDSVNKGEVDVITAYTSDGRIKKYDLIIIGTPPATEASYSRLTPFFSAM